MIYTIPKGKHYARFTFPKLHTGKTSGRWLVRFESSCLYTPDPENDWNKLCGWTYGLFNDKNSVRVGWRVNKNYPGKIELGLYLHVEGEKVYTNEGIFIEPEKAQYVALFLDWTKAVLHVSRSLDFTYSPRRIIDADLTPRFGYENRPYFGGNNTPERDMVIHLTPT